MSGSGDKEVFVGVVRSSGDAMFHRQDCAHAKRAMSANWYTQDDFQRGDVWCSACCRDLRFSLGATA